MSVKMQIPSLCKLYSFHEETPDEYLDEMFFTLHHFWQISIAASNGTS